MISRPKINFGEDPGSSQLIKQHVNAGKGVLIFDGDRIERAVSTHSLKLPSFFLKRVQDIPKEKNSGG
jgi:hypothetical protein